MCCIHSHTLFTLPSSFILYRSGPGEYPENACLLWISASGVWSSHSRSTCGAVASQSEDGALTLLDVFRRVGSRCDGLSYRWVRSGGILYRRLETTRPTFENTTATRTVASTSS